MIHQRTHPNLDVADCYGCRISSVAIAASAMPSRFPRNQQMVERDRRWTRDMSAYKTARGQGVQPKTIDGCADLVARAESKVEVESGQLLTKTQANTVASIMGEK